MCLIVLSDDGKVLRLAGNLHFVCHEYACVKSVMWY